MEKDKGSRRISIRSMKKEAAKVKQSSWWRCGMSKGTFSGVKVTVLWITYLLLGALAFQYIETTTSEYEEHREHDDWIRFKELAPGLHVAEELQELKKDLLMLCPDSQMNKTFELLEEAASDPASVTDGDLMKHIEVRKVENACSPALTIVEKLTKSHSWTTVDAIYFTMTAVTTIGYGHIYPESPKGRLFCVLYCLVGVPLTCILLAKSTDLLSSRMQRLYNTAKRRQRGSGRTLLYGVTVVYLTVGFLVFMLVPSIALTHLESWTLANALYMTFITLTTIGFGDLYPGYEQESPYWEYRDLYKMAIVIWIMVALGYWFLLLNFLQKVLRKNVPQKIKSIRKSKRFTKQSEFFKQLVSKVMSQRVQQQQSQQEDVGTEDVDSGVVALMVEVADALTSEDPRRPSLSVAGPGGRRGSRANPPLTLAQLLDVRVAVRGEAVPTLRNFVAKTPQSSSSSALQNLLAGEQDAPKESEVTLPLREVLTLVTLIKSVEDEVVAAEGDLSLSSIQDDGSTPSSPLSTVTSLDQPDYVPLIKAHRKESACKDDDEDDDDDDEESVKDVETGALSVKFKHIYER